MWSNNVILLEDYTIVNDQVSVCKVCFSLFNAVADNIGQNPNEIVNYQNDNDLDVHVGGVLQRQVSHPSVKNIKDRGIQDSFNFQRVLAEDIQTRLD